MCVVSMVAALARLREAAARIARLFGIRAIRNALRAQKGGRHYDCAAQICRKRARPPAVRRTPSIAAKAVGNRARGSIAATRRTSCAITAQSTYYDAPSAYL